MMDDNDRLREGTLQGDGFVDAVPLDSPGSHGSNQADGYEPFPVEALPEPARSFVAEAANAIGCDAAYVALPALAGLAASVGNTRRIQLKSGWCEPSVLWTVAVGESGTLKSPALEEALSPLRRLQAKAIAQYKTERQQYEDELERYERTVRSTRPNPATVELKKPAPPIRARFTCADTTYILARPRRHSEPRMTGVARIRRG